MAVGCPSIEELLSRTTSRDLAEWMAYEQIEPFGEQRADLRSAIIACTMANAWSGKGRKFTANDFMPKFGGPRRQDAMTMQAAMRSWVKQRERAMNSGSHSRACNSADRED